MTIQNPTYFWALLGLLVPLAIHLWSRKAGKTVKVGSTQWLIASENTRFSSLQFNEVWLFVARVIVVLLAVLILLDLVQKRPATPNKTSQTWILTEEDLLSDARVRPQIDSLTKSGIPLHLFKAGMPMLAKEALTKIPVQTKQDQEIVTDLNYWSYLNELNTRTDAPKRVIIFAQNTQKRFQGTKPTLNLEVEWVNLPQQRKSVFLLDALQLPNDSLLLSIGISDENGTQVLREKIGRQANTKIKDLPSVIVKDQQVQFAQVPNEGVQIRKPIPKKIHIAYTESHSLDQQYLKAALEAVGEYMQTEVRVTAAPIEQLEKDAGNKKGVDWAVFLGKAPENNAIFNIGNQQIVQGLKPTNQWFEQDEAQPTLHYLRQRANPEVNPGLLKDGKFLEEITQLLFANPNAQKRLIQFDQRKIVLSQASPTKKKQANQHLNTQDKTKKNTRNYHLLLWLGLVVGVVVERLAEATKVKV
ncbi:hypothetical protein BKI52_27425 [marine bacterium AO1-C]|nr:hypothetical protein BKI52_27425 [marine bacterium AO1-C]